MAAQADKNMEKLGKGCMQFLCIISKNWMCIYKYLKIKTT